jgi:hypothetical protein
MAPLAPFWLRTIQKKLHPQVAYVLAIKNITTAQMTAQMTTEPGFHLRDELAILTAMSASPCRIIPPVPNNYQTPIHLQRMYIDLQLHLLVEFKNLCHQFKNFRLATRVSRDVLEETQRECEPKAGLKAKENGCNVQNKLLGPKDLKPGAGLPCKLRFERENRES